MRESSAGIVFSIYIFIILSNIPLCVSTFLFSLFSHHYFFTNADWYQEVSKLKAKYESVERSQRYLFSFLLSFCGKPSIYRHNIRNMMQDMLRNTSQLYRGRLNKSPKEKFRKLL